MREDLLFLSLSLFLYKLQPYPTFSKKSSKVPSSSLKLNMLVSRDLDLISQDLPVKTLYIGTALGSKQARSSLIQL